MCTRVRLPGGEVGQLVSAVNLPMKKESPLLLTEGTQAKPQVTMVLMGVVVVGTAIILSPLANMVPVVDAIAAVEGEEEEKV